MADKKSKANDVPEVPPQSAREVEIAKNDRPSSTQVGAFDGDGNDYSGRDLRIVAPDAAGAGGPTHDADGNLIGAQGDTVPPVAEEDEEGTYKLDGYVVHDLTRSYHMSRPEEGHTRFFRLKEAGDPTWGMDIVIENALIANTPAPEKGKPEDVHLKGVIKQLKADKKLRQKTE